ncbi:hypothetical protein [Paenibacillus illinoisensis]|nr:hypothetical protein [Paenibacillus illinoisensis]
MGRAVAESGIPRKDIFITTKVADGDQVYDSCRVTRTWSH